MTPYQNILVPTDFSEISLTALDHAKVLAEKFSATLHFLHVLEDPLEAAAFADGYALPDDFAKRLKDEASSKLGDIVSATERMKYRVEWRIREGSPFVEIVRYARSHDINLIVMGTHGRGPIAHMLLGSVAEQVVRKAPCPVLVTRSPHQTFVMP